MLALKLLLTPMLIALATWVSRRWGPTVGGWFAALPLTSGPVLLVLAIERGPAFAAAASVGTLLALISLCACAVVWVRLAPFAHRIAGPADWVVCIVLSWTAFLLSTVALHHVSVPPVVAFPLVCGILLLSIRVLPADRTHRPSALKSPGWDIPVRMILAALLVFTMSYVAQTLGSRLSGLLTPLPIAVTILTAFAHRLEGAAVAAALMRGLLVGLFSFAVFFLVVSLTIERYGMTAAFAAAMPATLAVHAVIWRYFVAGTLTGGADRLAMLEGATRE